MPHAAKHVVEDGFEQTVRWPRARACRAWMSASALAVCLLPVFAAQARSSDRNEPMNIRSNHAIGTLDDNGTSVLTGDVTITQGTLDIRAAKADIQQRGGEPSRAILTGSQAVMKQTMDDGSPMTAKADRIEYDLLSDVVVLIGNYSITTPRGTTRGQRLTYDLKSGRIESGGQGNGPVTMTIQPKSRQTPKQPQTPGSGTPGSGTNPTPSPNPAQKPN
jgi:lipopolysaccharide export system protein LptA